MSLDVIQRLVTVKNKGKIELDVVVRSVREVKVTVNFDFKDIRVWLTDGHHVEIDANVKTVFGAGYLFEGRGKFESVVECRETDLEYPLDAWSFDGICTSHDVVGVKCEP